MLGYDSTKVFCVMLRKFIGFCIEHNITSATVVYGILMQNAISAAPIPLYLRSDFR